jgi:hypothetical protein
MSGQQELLKLLEIISQRIQYHHDALWEEAKHYSWWIYILFTGLIFLYIRLPGFTLLGPCQRALIMGFGSAFGIFISIMGFNAVRLESKYFKADRQKRNRILLALEVDQAIKKDFDPVKDKESFGIRRGFKLTFIITAILFLLFGILSVLTLVQSS